MLESYLKEKIIRELVVKTLASDGSILLAKELRIGKLGEEMLCVVACPYKIRVVHSSPTPWLHLSIDFVLELRKAVSLLRGLLLRLLV